MPFGRRYPLRNADGETSQVVAPVVPAPVAPPVAAPAFDAEAAKADLRKALLEELGIKDPEEAKAAIKAAKDAADARLSEAEKQAKALKQSLEEKSKAEAEAAALKAEIKAIKAAGEMRDKLDGFGVEPTARVMVEALYLASSKAKDFDEKSFFEKIQAEHPTLFRSGAVAPANTSPTPVAAASSPFGSAPQVFDALKATPEERRERRRSLS